MPVPASQISQVIVSVLVTIGFVTVLAILMLTRINFSATSGQAFLVLVGVLATTFAQVVNYWVGSSAGSAAKSQLLANIAEKAPTP